MKRKHVVKYLTGTMAVALLLAGCEDGDIKQAEDELNDFDKTVQATKGVLVVVQEVTKGEFKIQDESPCSVTKIIVKHLDGTTEVLNESQAKNLFNQDKAKHGGDYSNSNSFPMWWLLYNSNFGYGLGRNTPPSPAFARYYVTPRAYQKSEFFAPNIAKGFTGSSKVGVSPAMRTSISASARSGFGGGFSGGGGS